MDLDPQIGSAKDYELDSLAIQVEAYEKVHFNRDVPTSEEAAKFREDQMKRS